MKREILIPSREKGVAVFTVNTSYTGLTGIELIQIYGELVGSDCMGRFYRRNSRDNGFSWSEAVPFFEPVQTDNGTIRQMEPCLYLDKEKNILIYFYYKSLFPKGGFSVDMRRYIKIYYRSSRDGGKSFSDPVQLIQKGYDGSNWADGAIYGQSSFGMSFCSPVKVNGRILLPVYKKSDNNENNDKFTFPYYAGCFIGSWQGEKLEWELSDLIKIDPALSSRGVSEPVLAQLCNGDIMMILRGSNAGMPDVPGYKWKSISQDGGYTWSVPVPFTYHDNVPFYSPSSGSALIRNSENSRLYWIGNISGENPKANRPRYPLYIAEVDEDEQALKKSALRIIDDKKSSDPPQVQFSNFRVYEDRKTHEFILNMARLQEKGKTDLTSPAYQYRIKCN